MSMGSKRSAGPGGEALLSGLGPDAGENPGNRLMQDAHPAPEASFASPAPFTPDADTTTPLGAAGSTRQSVERDDNQGRNQDDLLGTASPSTPVTPAPVGKTAAELAAEEEARRRAAAAAAVFDSGSTAGVGGGVGDSGTADSGSPSD